MTDWTDDLDDDMTEPVNPKSATRNIRFWMPPGSERTIVFLTAKPSFAFWEHAVKLKDWRNFATCLCHLPDTPCPLCYLGDAGAQVQKYKAQPFTIIDRTEFIGKHGENKGKKIKDRKRLIIAKSRVAEKIARKAQARIDAGQSLRFAEFKVFRSKDATSPGVGDDFEFLRMVDPKEFEDVEEFDYKELLKPDLELVTKLANGAKATLGAGGGDVERVSF